MTDLISIIIPVYNTEKYLVRCLDSVLAQTYSKLEIILVDDGSTDRSGEICEEYAKKDNRIKVIHQVNGGQSAARNNAIKVSTGAYLGFVDSDDYIEKDMYECLYQTCIQNKTDIAVCGYLRMNDRDKVMKTFLPSNIEEVITRKEAVYEVLKDTKLYSFLWDKLFKRELFDDIHFPEGKIFEDVACVYQIINKADTIALCPVAKYYYVIRNSSTITAKSQKKFSNQLDAYEEQLLFAQNNCKEAQLWVEYHVAEVRRRILDCSVTEKGKEVKGLKKDLMLQYRVLLHFILKSEHISLGKKISAFVISFSPSAYLLLRQVKAG